MWARWLLLVSLCLGKVFILSPQKLVDELISKYGGETADLVAVSSTIANFGNPPYGSKLVGKAFFHPDDNFACLPLDHITVPKEVPILLADRGNCTFVMKAKHAQNAGYKALIIIDNVDEPVEEIIMTDNGSGGNIFIPALMIRSDDGNKVKSFAAKPEDHVEIRLTFDIEQRSRVSLRIVYSSDNAKAYSFFSEFAPYSSRFNQTVLSFHPHFALWYDVDAAAEGYTSEKRDCLGGGRYCAPDPDGEGALTGQDVVKEDLRQICLLMLSLKRFSSYSLWFDYTAQFGSLCRGADMTQTCSHKVLASLGLVASEVETCIESSAIADGKGEKSLAVSKNTLLQKEVKMWKNLGIEFFPAILINNRTYRGDWEGLQVAQTICSGYLEAPEFCASLSSADKPTPLVVATGTVVLLVAVSLVLVIAVLVLYRAWVKRELNLEMKQQVNLAVSQYYALNSEGSQMAEHKSSARSN